MATEVENLIDHLNTLVKINLDRIEGYTSAAKDIEDVRLKALFEGSIKNSTDFVDDLSEQVEKYGETPAESGTTAGKLHRSWLDFKGKLMGKDRESILSTCETGENTAIAAYTEVLDTEKIKALPELSRLLIDQRQLIQSDLRIIQSLQAADSNT